jgi:uncharacterized protein (TIRG00374 family)
LNPSSRRSAHSDAEDTPRSRGRTAFSSKKALLLAAKLAGTFLLLYWLLDTGRIDLARLTGLLAGGQSRWLRASFLLGLACLLLPVLRWHLLLRAQDARVGLPAVFRWTFIGAFVNSFVPSGVAGDFLRGYYVVAARDSGRISMLSTVLADRLVGLHSLLLIGFVILSILLPDPRIRGTGFLISWALLGAAAVGSALAIALTGTLLKAVGAPRQHRYIAILRDMIAAYRGRASLVAIAYAVALVNALLNVLLFHTAGRALGFVFPVWIAGVSVPVFFTSNILPVAPGGLGVGEAATGEIMAALSYDGGGNVALLARTCVAAWTLLGAVLLVTESRKGADRGEDTQRGVSSAAATKMESKER